MALNFMHSMSNSYASLSRRERQILDVIYSKGRATAYEILEALPEVPSYSAIRITLASLEKKGHLRHEKDGLRYVFIPNVSATRAKRTAVKHLLRTFFGGSREQFLSTLLDSSSAISEEECDRLTSVIEKARKEGRR
jgi:BlaI family transcriptional regulator, penicillinase repressor